MQEARNIDGINKTEECPPLGFSFPVHGPTARTPANRCKGTPSIFPAGTPVISFFRVSNRNRWSMSAL
jgi:hypothetical protein